MIGARVSALSSGDEILVSGTVRDMVFGSGYTFTPEGDISSRVCPAIGSCSRSIPERPTQSQTATIASTIE